MNMIDAAWQIGTLLPGRLLGDFDVAPDTWFKIAAILTLWAYVIFGPDREPTES
jgi:hypothetical protein